MSSDESTLGLQTAAFLLYPDMGDRKRALKSLPLLNKITNLLCMLNHFSHVRLFATLWTVACQPPLSMGSSRQEYWSGLPCPPAGDLPDPGIKPTSLALQLDSLLLIHREALCKIYLLFNCHTCNLGQIFKNTCSNVQTINAC